MKYNLYSTLGVKPKATAEEIKKGYRKVAKAFHPDKNPNDKTAAKKMLEINEAYEILSDEVKKKKYDEDLLRHLKLEIEREKAKAERESHRSRSTNIPPNEQKSYTIEETIKEGVKSVLVGVLRFVLRR